MLGEAFRFVAVGGAATAVHWLTYVGLNACFGLTRENDVGLSVTYALGYGVSFIGNYVASLKWTFKTAGSLGKGIGFAFSHLVNFGLHMGLLNVLLWWGGGDVIARFVRGTAPLLVERFPLLGSGETWLPVPVFCLVVPINFLMVRYFLTRDDEKKA